MGKTKFVFLINHDVTTAQDVLTEYVIDPSKSMRQTLVDLCFKSEEVYCSHSPLLHMK